MKKKRPLRSQHNGGKENNSYETKETFTGFYTEVMHQSIPPAPSPHSGVDAGGID